MIVFLARGISDQLQAFGGGDVCLIGLVVKLEAACDHAAIDFYQLQNKPVSPTGRNAIGRNSDADFSKVKFRPVSRNSISVRKCVLLDVGQDSAEFLGE